MKALSIDSDPGLLTFLAIPQQKEVSLGVLSRLTLRDKGPIQVHALMQGVAEARVFLEIIHQEGQSNTTGAAMRRVRVSLWGHQRDALIPHGKRGHTNPLHARPMSRGIPLAEHSPTQGHGEQNPTPSSTGQWREEIIGAADLIRVEAPSLMGINPAQTILHPAAQRGLIRAKALPVRVEGPIPMEEFPHREALLEEATPHPAAPPGLTPEVVHHAQAASPIPEDVCPHPEVLLPGAVGVLPVPNRAAPRQGAPEGNSRPFYSSRISPGIGCVHHLDFNLCGWHRVLLSAKGELRLVFVA